MFFKGKYLVIQENSFAIVQFCFCIRLTTVYHIDEVYFETFVEQEEQQQQPKTVEQIALAYLDAKIKDTQ